MAKKSKKPVEPKDDCPHCGHPFVVEKGKKYEYTCPECGRMGCDFCMPAGNNCLCPDCEDEME